MSHKQKNSLAPKKSMKLGSSARFSTGHSDSLAQTLMSSQSSSGQVRKEVSGHLRKQSQQQWIDAKKSSMATQVVMLSKSMEKSFRRLKNRDARKAFVEAELVNGLAHQIRILRQQRGWTQQELASKLKTTQTAISRLEDPSYGRFSVKSLLALGDAFDVALHVRFESFSKFLFETWDTREENFYAESYEDESETVQFFGEAKGSTYISSLTHKTTETRYKIALNPVPDRANEIQRTKAVVPIVGICGYLLETASLK